MFHWSKNLDILCVLWISQIVKLEVSNKCSPMETMSIKAKGISEAWSGLIRANSKGSQNTKYGGSELQSEISKLSSFIFLSVNSSVYVYRQRPGEGIRVTCTSSPSVWEAWLDNWVMVCYMWFLHSTESSLNR